MRIFVLFILLLLTEHQTFGCNITIYGNYNRAPKTYLEDGKAKGIIVEMMQFVGNDIDCQFDYSTIQDLANKRIVSNSASEYGEEFVKARKDKLFTLVEDNGDLSARLKFVLLGRADIAFISPNLASIEKVIMEDEYLRQHRDEIYIFPTSFRRDPNYLGFSKKLKMSNFLKKFNLSIKKALESGAFEKILLKHSQ